MTLSPLSFLNSKRPFPFLSLYFLSLKIQNPQISHCISADLFFYHLRSEMRSESTLLSKVLNFTLTLKLSLVSLFVFLSPFLLLFWKIKLKKLLCLVMLAVIFLYVIFDF
ncbi:hypothetical protein LguiB_027863 [Lonicera macranthoides]